MNLADQLDRAKERIRRGEFDSEEAVRQGIILPVLQALGWPIFETPVVFPEYSLGTRRVDYALCHPARKPSVFVEAKKIGHVDGADRQLFEYAFHEGVPIAVLTDGQEWSFYLPGEQGRYDERRVYKLDLLESASPRTTFPSRRLSAVATLPVPAPAEESTHVPRSAGLRLTFRGNDYPVRAAKGIVIEVFQLLAKEDISILRRFAARKHGKKRRYLSQAKEELYPGRPDLAEDFSREVAPGWWLGTNYSRRDIKRIIDLAMEVAGSHIAKDFTVSVSPD